jgi:hypothetical protein
MYVDSNFGEYSYSFKVGERTVTLTPGLMAAGATAILALALPGAGALKTGIAAAATGGVAFEGAQVVAGQVPGFRSSSAPISSAAALPAATAGRPGLPGSGYGPYAGDRQLFAAMSRWRAAGGR